MNITQLRKATFANLKGKSQIVDKRTYASLERKFYDVSSSKIKLGKFNTELNTYTKNVNTKKKLKQEKQIINLEKKNFSQILKQNKKNISFYASFYIPLKITQIYGGSDSIEYGGKIYIPISRKNGDEGSFFLERQSTINTALIMKWLQTHKLNNNPKSAYFEYLKQFEGFKEFHENYFNLLISQSDILISLTSINIDSNDNTPLNYATEFAFDDVNSCMFLSVKEYVSIPDKVEFTHTYIKDNYLPASCWLTLLLNIYKKPIEKYYKKTTLTYEYIHNLIAPTRQLLSSRNGYTINEVIVFFKLWKISIYVLDINMNVVTYYEPEARNKNFAPNVLYVIFHDKHIYHINNNLKKFEQKLKAKLESRTCICPVPNNKYFTMDKSEDITTTMVNTYEQLREIMDETHDEINGKYNDIQILYNNPSCFDLWYRFYKEGINPAVLITDGEVCYKYMRIDGYYGNNYIISTNSEEAVYEHTTFDTQDTFSHYMSKKNWISNNLLTKDYKSSYSTTVSSMLNTYMTSPLMGQFKQTDITEGIKLDFNKYYTSILMNMKYIPMVNAFDEFREYNNEPIHLYNIYFVEKLDNKQTYPYHKFSLCYGINIKGVANIRIKAFVEVSNLKKNASKKIVKELYKDTKLTPKLRKNLINHLVGNYNKKENKKYYTSICKHRNEAETIKKEYGGRIIPQSYQVEDRILEIDEDEHETNFEKETFYLNYIENKNDINEGFRLVSLFIYDTAHKILLDLKAKLQSYNIHVIKCNTDCLDIAEHSRDNLNLFIADNKELFTYTHKDAYDAIGKIKVEQVSIRNTSPVRTMYSENIYDTIKTMQTETNQIELKDEFNRDEIASVICSYPNLLIKADVAGAGKTSSFLHNCVVSKEKTLIITPFNALCLELTNTARLYEKEEKIENNQLCSITIHNLLGMTYDGDTDKNAKKTAYDVGDIKRIIFDEIYLNNTFMLSRIREYMIKHPEIIFNATGDEYQNKPIEELTISDPKKYYNNIIAGMFPNCITLHENKRCHTDADRTEIKSLTGEIRNATNKEQVFNIFKKYNINTVKKIEDVQTVRNICAKNDTCEWVSDTVYKRIHKNNKYFVGQQLICRKSLKGKDYRTFVNYTYTITEITESSMSLNDLTSDENEAFTLPIKSIHSYFTLSYAQTCHSTQGMSINEPITIFDINSWFVDICWIYTAITRVTSIKNINIYMGEVESINVLEHQIDKMIKGHSTADKKAKRDYSDDYITTDWVMYQLKNTKYCLYCSKHFDTSGIDCFSVDRINNNLAHTTDNCQIICRKCNVSKK